jgi:hypothetical protein
MAPAHLRGHRLYPEVFTFSSRLIKALNFNIIDSANRNGAFARLYAFVLTCEFLSSPT